MIGRSVGATLALLALLLACFAGLVADPAALIVDADRPSLDHAASPLDAPTPGNDLTRLFLPHHLAIARSIAATGHPPTWDDRGFGGRPLVGNPQAGLFYPPTWLAWRIGSPATLGWITVAHLLFAGLGTLRLARTLGLGGWGALTAAGCVQASPYLLAQVFEGHYPHAWAACWYPWAFDAAVRLRRGGRRAPLALAAILAASFLAGHPQEGYYLAVALGCWAAYEGVAAILAGRRRDALRLWGGWALALGLAAGLVGVEVVPDAMAEPWCLKGARLSLKLAGRYHLDPINALQLLSPTALGGPADYFGPVNYWESVTSIGLVPLALAIVAAAWSGDRRGVRGWLILVLASVLFASGRKLGLFALAFEVVPGMDHFRVPARSLFLASLGASMLAGMGVEALRARAADDRAWARLARRAAIAALVIVAAVEAGRRLAGRVAPSGSGRLREADRLLMGLDRLAVDPTFLVALGGTAALLACGWRRPGARKAVAATLGWLALVELGIHGHSLIVTSPAGEFLGSSPTVMRLAVDRPAGLEPTRIRVEGSLYDDLRAARDGFTKTSVNDSFQIQHAADLYQALYLRPAERQARAGRPLPADADPRRWARERRAVLDRMNVTFQVLGHVDPAASSWSLESKGFSPDYGRKAGSPYATYRNPTALPRAYVIPWAHLIADDAPVLPSFLEVDPREAVLMPSDPLGLDHPDRQPFTPAEWASTDPDRVVIRVTTRLPGLLVVADTWMPGWSAEVDGRPQPVLRGNHAQRVVPLAEPGRHEVVLTYRPPGLAIGLALTAGSALVGMALLVATRTNRRSSDDCH